MDRLQHQQPADAPLPPRRPDGSLGPPLSKPTGESKGFITSLKEQWQLPGVTEVLRLEAPTSAASLSRGSGSSVRSPSALNHLSHDSDAARAGRSAVPCRQTPIGTLQRQETSPSSPVVQAPAIQPVTGGSFGPKTSTSSTVAPTGVPVTKHFDPRRTSPFELSKFDRRDPYVHFYIPVDCPFARRCCDGICPLAHTKLEKIFHPIVYKTQKCQMALADNGRCPYINKCAFFHSEEDRREAELHWKAWEAEWASWRQQIDQLLLRHHKLEKEIRRKVEGIIKIRMPRSSSSDLLERYLADRGVLTGLGEQKKAAVQQSSQGVGAIESGIGSVSFSAPRGRSFTPSGFAGDVMPCLADSCRTSSGPRLAESLGFCGRTEAPMFGLQAASAACLADSSRTSSGPRLAESVGFCGRTEAPMFGLQAASAACLADAGRTSSGPRLAESVFCGRTEAPMFGLQATSAVIGNTRRVVEHREDHAFPAGREWLYIANSWNKEIAQQYKPGGGFVSRVETSSISTRSTLQETLAPVVKNSKAFHASGTLVPIPELGTKLDAKAALPSERGHSLGLFGQRAADSGSLYGALHKPYGCSTLSAGKDHESLPLRTGEASVRAVTTTEVERGNRVVSTVITSETQQTVAISTPVDTTVASRMSTRESKGHGEASSYPQPLNVFVCKPLHFARSSQAIASSVKPAIVGTLPSAQSAVERECAGTLQTIGGCRVPGHPSRLVIQTPSTCIEIRDCEDERGVSVPSGGSSCRSNVLCSLRASSDQQAVNAVCQEDCNKAVWSRGATEGLTLKERGQAGGIQGDSEGASPRPQQPSTWTHNSNDVGVQSASAGAGASESGQFEGQEPVRVTEDDAVAAASQPMPVQRSASLVDAPPLPVRKSEYVAQVETLSSVASQGSQLSPASCTPAFGSSADGERPGFDSADDPKGSALPTEFGGGAKAEMDKNCNAPSSAPSPNDDVANLEGEPADTPPKPAAAEAGESSQEEQAFGRLWEPAASTEGAGVSTRLPDVSEGEAFSVAIDTVMCQAEIPFSGGCVTVSKDELNLLARKLNHLLRTAAEEVRRLDIGALGDLSSMDEQRQDRSRMEAEPTLNAAGLMEDSAISGSPSNQAVEALPSSDVSLAGAEVQRRASTVATSETRHHTPY
ncbi:hypothetical protein, conserved [Eimeria praecox]|uniref:C3H1-type domain-containing protein n=1 Tax=Eimeria praecox TaxID=51316 RepID=U6G6D3_9EIME|nr:hypothetical protein, conserved [Eimeria praecox]